MNDLSAVPIDLENYRYANGSDINDQASANATAAAVFLYGKDANGRWVFFLGQNDFGRPKLWTVPGGTVEPGLNSSATAAQELYEETAGYQGFHPGIYDNVEAVKAAPVYNYVNEQGKIVDIYFIDLNEMGMLQKNMTDALREIDANGTFRDRAVEITKKVGAKYREDRRTGRITSAYTEKFRWAAVPFEDLCQFLLKSPTGPRDFSAYEIMINGRQNSIRDVDAKSLRAFFNQPAHQIAKFLPPEPMNILLSCKGPVSPRPVSPLPVRPRQVSPLPVSPRQVSPLPVSPRPVSPLPVTQVRPVSPRPVIPRPVSPLPVTQVRPVSPRPVTQVKPVVSQPIIQFQRMIPRPITQFQPRFPRPVTQVQPVSPQPVVQPVIPRPVTQVRPVMPLPVTQVRPVSPVVPLSPPREESPPQAQYLPATGRPLFQVPFPAPLPSQTGRPAGPTPTEISRARGFDIRARYRPETE